MAAGAGAAGGYGWHKIHVHQKPRTHRRKPRSPTAWPRPKAGHRSAPPASPEHHRRIQLGDFFLLRGINNQIAMLSACARSKLSPPIVGHGNRARFRQLEVTVVRMVGIQCSRHSRHRRIVWHRLERLVSIHNRMRGRPGEIRGDAGGRIRNRIANFGAHKDDRSRPLSEYFFRSGNVRLDTMSWTTIGKRPGGNDHVLHFRGNRAVLRRTVAASSSVFDSGPSTSIIAFRSFCASRIFRVETTTFRGIQRAADCGRISVLAIRRFLRHDRIDNRCVVRQLARSSPIR